jgi:hypothetical protein
VPLALPIWLLSRRAPAGTLARLLGSWMLLLGRNVVLRGIKRGGPGDIGGGSSQHEDDED